ncbi:LOG family protein [Nocardioides donggukensis]|uniref:Rossmann fold nucleotide-binding protein n=1 Tax=Nocardioides donggukensis TaxID=2774019 RepID=A0A927PZG0_9ACTN|nr:LOG family protein [Nocardioides donggukensis]MBD8869055.1 Rossmann fold nucleotide-binding protein [Nocardioides donggukensis]
MRWSRGRTVEVETLADLDHRLAAGARSLDGWHLQSLDLTERGAVLRRVDPAGALFLGCRFAGDDAELVRERGGIVFPQVPDVPVDTYRTTLYTADELFDAGRYDECTDARVYAWSQQPATPDVALAMALHDHAVDEALSAWAAGRRIAGVMGGHALARGSAGYAEAARLGHLLGRTAVVATGGGPGAMEAANLGARLAGAPAAALGSALDRLAAVPGFHPDVGAWARVAFEVRDAHRDAHPASDPDSGQTLGVPTWHYGHEPPNVFATAIAKYFRNATREAVLLALCNAGIVFLPGAAGTVQEVFQDACENYYADPGSTAPMVLVGVEHWTRTLPAWPLLEALARDRVMEPRIHLVDTVEEAAALLDPS